ncbi:MAG TPA: MFS transporter, partial [Dehalococcoidia bacterium]|nr:MFS transporter [Dehalococcoidia bacterium]
ERTVVPLIGSQEFLLSLNIAITSFIISFGVVKALTNLLAGSLADSWGRRRILILGWLVGVPVPFIIMGAPNWWWIVAANALLGVNQGLTWSMTVTMKIDLVGPGRRGLAMGLNEFAGYLAVGLTALATGYLASRYGLRPEPFYLGIAYALLGLLLSWLLVRETKAHALLEASSMADPSPAPSQPSFRSIFALTSWRDRSLFAASQAGLVNNLNDGMSWGIFPLFFAAHGLEVEGIGILKALYPATWGALQILTGPLSDRWGRKPLIAWGMVVQALGIWLTVFTRDFAAWAAGAVLLGVGTAMVYPSLLAAVSDVAHPAWRARSLGVYRFWRDIGYAVGALSAGIIADLFGLTWAIAVIGGLTLASGLVAALAMRETRTPRQAPALAPRLYRDQ